MIFSTVYQCGIVGNGFTVESHAQVCRAMEFIIEGQERWYYDQAMVPYNTAQDTGTEQKAGVVHIGRGEDTRPATQVPDQTVDTMRGGEATEKDLSHSGIDTDTAPHLDEHDVSHDNTEAESIQFIEVTYT